MAELVTGCACVYILRRAANHLAAVLPAPAAAAVPPAASLPAGAPARDTAKSEEAEADEGVRYEGWTEAIASAAAQVRADEKTLLLSQPASTAARKQRGAPVLAHEPGTGRVVELVLENQRLQVSSSPSVRVACGGSGRPT